MRVALNKNILSISLRKRLKPKLDFSLKLVNLKREKPKYKNLKYKKILSYLSKMDNSKSDIGLVHRNRLFETGTSYLLFVCKGDIFSPSKNFYKGITYNFFKQNADIEGNILQNEKRLGVDKNYVNDIITIQNKISIFNKNLDDSIDFYQKIKFIFFLHLNG